MYEKSLTETSEVMMTSEVSCEDRYKSLLVMMKSGFISKLL